MEYQNLLVKDEAGITTITLNRPQVMNALSPALLQELKLAIIRSGEDKSVRVLVVTGMGKAFSAGADLNSLGNQKLENGRVGPIIDKAAKEVIKAIEDIPKVVIAMINGHCYTGALELALACDLIVAGESARFGDTHVRWGIRPSWGMSQRLPRRIGWLRAKELSFTAKIITAVEAERIGLINKTVADSELRKEVNDLAALIMDNSLEAVAAYKCMYNQGILTTIQEGLDYEAKSEFTIGDTQSRIDGFRRK